MHRRLRLSVVLCLGVLAAAAASADQAQWEQYIQELRALRQKGAYAEAEKAALAAIQEAEKSGLAEIMMARSWNNLGALYYDVGRYAEAEGVFQRATNLWEKLMGPEHLELAQ